MLVNSGIGCKYLAVDHGYTRSEHLPLGKALTPFCNLQDILRENNDCTGLHALETHRSVCNSPRISVYLAMHAHLYPHVWVCMHMRMHLYIFHFKELMQTYAYMHTYPAWMYACICLTRIYVRTYSHACVMCRDLRGSRHLQHPMWSAMGLAGAAYLYTSETTSVKQEASWGGYGTPDLCWEVASVTWETPAFMLRSCFTWFSYTWFMLRSCFTWEIPALLLGLALSPSIFANA